jgi:hypothetical protein
MKTKIKIGGTKSSARRRHSLVRVRTVHSISHRSYEGTKKSKKQNEYKALELGIEPRSPAQLSDDKQKY